jgi:hypothetical protein
MRAEAVLFGSTANETVAFPPPEAPDVILTQLWLLVAVQEQAADAVTATVPVPPPAVKSRNVGESEFEQEGCGTIQVP